MAAKERTKENCRYCDGVRGCEHGATVERSETGVVSNACPCGASNRTSGPALLAGGARCAPPSAPNPRCRKQQSVGAGHARPLRTAVSGTGGSGRLAARNERRQPAKLARSCGCLPRRGKHCSLPQFRSAQLWPRVRNPAPRRNSGSFLWFFLLLPKERTTSRGTAVTPSADHFPLALWIYCLGVWLYSARNAR